MNINKSANDPTNINASSNLVTSTENLLSPTAVDKSSFKQTRASIGNVSRGSIAIQLSPEVIAMNKKVEPID